MKNKKTLWIVAAVVIIVAGVCILAFYNNQPQPTNSLPENWTFFENDTYSYKIAHPKSWPVSAQSPEQVSLGQVPWEPAPGSIFISVLPNENFFYLDEFKQGYSEGCRDVETKMIANLNTVKLICTESFAGQETNEYFFEHGKDLYHISFISGQPDLNAIFEKMIQTFDFE